MKNGKTNSFTGITKYFELDKWKTKISKHPKQDLRGSSGLSADLPDLPPPQK